jgi:hypothetical protein
LSAEERGRGIPHGTVNKQAGLEKAEAAAHAQQPGAEKLVKMLVEGKLHRRGGKVHFPCELQINTPAGEAGVAPPPQVCLERRKHVTVAVMTRRTLNKQSL